MNSTQTAILEALAYSNSYHSVKELQTMTGKGETTIRENLKKLLEQGDVQKDGKLYTNTPIVPEVEIVAEATVEPAVVDAPAAPVEAVQTASEDAPAKKVYKRHATPTTRTVRVNQITKFEVQVLKASEYADENPQGKWVTICLEHDTVGWSDLVLDAHFASTYPEFCPTCLPLLAGKVGRRRKDAKKA